MYHWVPSSEAVPVRACGRTRGGMPGMPGDGWPAGMPGVPGVKKADPGIQGIRSIRSPGGPEGPLRSSGIDAAAQHGIFRRLPFAHIVALRTAPGPRPNQSEDSEGGAQTNIRLKRPCTFCGYPALLRRARERGQTLSPTVSATRSPSREDVRESYAPPAPSPKGRVPALKVTATEVR